MTMGSWPLTAGTGTGNLLFLHHASCLAERANEISRVHDGLWGSDLVWRWCMICQDSADNSVGPGRFRQHRVIYAVRHEAYESGTTSTLIIIRGGKKNRFFDTSPFSLERFCLFLFLFLKCFNCCRALQETRVLWAENRLYLIGNMTYGNSSVDCL